jgi:hypothetical protein
MKKKMLSVMTIALLSAVCLLAGGAKAAGKWQMSLESPHGPMTAGLDMKQEGGKLTGTCSSDHLGTIPINGTVDGEKISFTIQVTDGPKLTFNGTIADNKITGTSDFGAWSATKQ